MLQETSTFEKIVYDYWALTSTTLGQDNAGFQPLAPNLKDDN